MKYKFKIGDRVRFVGPLGRVYCGEIVREWPDGISYSVREGGINYRMYGSSLTLTDAKEEPEVKRQKFKAGDWVSFSTVQGDEVGVIATWSTRYNEYCVVDRDGTISFRREDDLTLIKPTEELAADQPFTVKVEEKEVVQTVKVKTVHLTLTEDEFKVIMRALNAHPQSAVSDLWDRLDDFANDNGIIDDESEF